VLYAQQEDGHEEGCHCSGSSLKCLSMVLDLFDLLLSIGNHVFVVGLFKFKEWGFEAGSRDCRCKYPFAFYERSMGCK